MKKTLMAFLFSGTIALVGQQLINQGNHSLALSDIKLVNEAVAESSTTTENMLYHHGGHHGGYERGGYYRGGYHRGGYERGGYRW